MTQRLYYTDCYLRNFEADIIDRADDGRRVYLDRTAFYPTSGGQPFDTGRLGGVEVTDVVDEGDFIGAVASPPAVVLAASPDTGVDAAGVLRGLLATVGGRGGGSATLAQGILPGRAQLDAVISSIAGTVASTVSSSRT